MPTRSRHKGYKRLTLPYPSRNQFPSDPSPAYDDDYGYEYKSKFDLENTHTPMDPYHVVNSLDNSLISKDANFMGASIPVAAKEQKKSGKFGLGLGITMAERKSPIPEHAEHLAEDNESHSLTPPPPPAYLRNPRWDM
ncbi:hypothetical protein JR316_0007304 [Psilocybe cubensis]|uniref:Uncharacterized protein n=2 Tax=Psilocybe cubensis TaxID=181762 RepID=A0ACB8GZ16_PSICU|nr:hypothetical protein JR316_0007304 [Psilocybe cubensis]KAH9480704.1 hypothetical protein JR316_0007304 [Psilocybe cubensis]